MLVFSFCLFFLSGGGLRADYVRFWGGLETYVRTLSWSMVTQTNPRGLSETKNTYHRPDPSFTYLLTFVLLLTSLAWGIAYLPSASRILLLALSFVCLHYLALSLLISTFFYILLGRMRFLRRGAGRFSGGRIAGEGEEGLEFGYCFDVASRSFFPVWVWLYAVQFFLMPVVSRDYW